MVGIESGRIGTTDNLMKAIASGNPEAITDAADAMALESSLRSEGYDVQLRFDPSGNLIGADGLGSS